jgi:predicted dehydrogenase
MSALQTRREFFKRGTKASAILAVFPQIVSASVLGKNGRIAPSNKITLGMIGTGSHGINMNLKSFLPQEDAQIVAVCDVDREHVLKARDLVNEKYGHQDCAIYEDFREILIRKDIDAVMISTPDHWHVPMSLMAMQSGKDVICEKPTMTIQEGRDLVNAVKRHIAVFQTSTEDRSLYQYHRLAELVRNGRIGRLQTIHVTLPQQPEVPGDPTPMPVPENLNWNLWLGPAPESYYTIDRVHFNFRWHFDTSAGIIADWGTHLFDTAQWANDTETSGPVHISSRGTFWTCGLYNTPKDYHVEYTYANGVKMIVDHGGTGIRCEGTEGWIEVPYWRAPLQADPPAILTSVIRPDEIKLFTCPQGEHRNFLNCVKSRKQPYFPAEIGHRVATLCHLANISLLLKRDLDWDPQRQVFPNDPEANRMLSRSMRSPWHL